MRTLLESLHLHADSLPAAEALVDSISSTTYRELSRIVTQFGQFLASGKLAKGDRIAVIADKQIECVCAIFGGMQAGAIAVPVNPLLKAEQVRHIIDDSGATVLVIPARHAPTLGSIIRRCASLRLVMVIAAQGSDPASTQHAHRPTDNPAALPAIDLASHQQLAQWQPCWQPNELQDQQQNAPDTIAAKPNEALPTISLDDHSAILYTSGSTGKSKGVLLTHGNLAYGGASVSSYLGNTPEDRILAIMPLSFDYGLSQLTTAISVGATAVLFDYLIPRGLVDAVVKYRISGVAAVPIVWNQMVNLEWPAVPHLRYITNTGGRMHASTTLALMQKLPNIEVFLMYGFTEAFRSTYLPPAQAALRPDSIGKAVPFANIAVVDPDGNDVADNEIGELIHSGPLLSAGYWNDTLLNEAKFRARSEHDGEIFAWSGDLVKCDAEGYLYFVSRRDDQVKLNGYRVYPGEIEEIIARSAQVVDVAVIFFEQELLGHYPVAIVVAKARTSTADVEAYCRQHLPGYMVPSKVFLTDALPIGPNNKVDRQNLADTYRAQLQ